MAIALVSQGSNSSATATVTFAFSPNNTAGNLLVILGGCVNTSATISAISGNGNTYTSFAGPTGAGGLMSFGYYVKNCNAGANTVSVTFSSTGGFAEIACFEFSGCDQTAPFDQLAIATGTSLNPSSGLCPTTTAASEVLAGYILYGSHATAGGTLWTSTIPGTGNLYQYRIVSSTGTYQSDSTQSDSNIFAAVMGTFKASGGNAQNATDTISPGGAIVGTSVIQRRASNPIAPHAAIVATSKHIANATVTI